MDLNKVIQARKSVRKFSDKTPDWRDIIEAVDSCRYAPTAGNNFSLKVIIIDDKNKIQQIADASQQQFISQAQYVVVFCSVQERLTNLYDQERGKRYLRQQAGAAMENFILNIIDKGLSTCWVGHFIDDEIKHLLKIPESVFIEALFPIGYESKALGEVGKKRDKVNIDGFLYFNEYKIKKMHKPKRIR